MVEGRNYNATHMMSAYQPTPSAPSPFQAQLWCLAQAKQHDEVQVASLHIM